MQVDAVLSQANPTSGTQYEVLATTQNVRLISISVMVTWTVQPTPLEVWVTIDGISTRFYFNNPVSATDYFPFITPGVLATALLQDMNVWNNALVSRPYILECKSIRVQVETTGGTVQNLDCRVKYAQW